jgi:hypothetical protein
MWALWTSLTALGLLGRLQEPRAPLPDPTDVKRVEKEIRALFKEEYTRKDPAGKRALAHKLFENAEKTKSDAVGRYVLFSQARELSVEAGDVLLAFLAIDRIAGEYETKAEVLRSAALAGLRRSPASAEEVIELAVGCQRVGSGLFLKGDWEWALKLAKEAEHYGKAAKDVGLVAAAARLSSQSQECKKEADRAAKAKQLLDTKPDDPEANLEYGRFLCFVRRDWAAGAGLLVKGSDPSLRAVAGKELLSPATASDQLELAEAWVELSEKTRESLFKDRYRERARTWFEKVTSTSDGLERTKACKRLEDLDRASGIEDLLRLIDSKRDAVSGEWTFEGSTLVSPFTTGAKLQVPFIPPLEYDLLIVLERKEGGASFILGLPVGRGQVKLSVGGWMEDLPCLELVDGKRLAVNDAIVRETQLLLQKQATILCSVRAGNVRVTVDDKEVLNWVGDFKRLSLPTDWGVPNKNALFIGETMVRFHVSRMTLRSVTGQGQRLR